MNDKEKGEQFLKLIDDQNNLQWKIVAKLTSLISSEWNSEESKNELKTTILRYARFVELKLKRFKNITFKLQDKILERIKC